MANSTRKHSPPAKSATRPRLVIPEALCEVDPWYWAYFNKIRLQSGDFALVGHEYLIDVMQSTARVRVARKGAQMGWTEAEVLRTLHGLIHGTYPSGVLYLFPTSDDVSEFSKARFGPLIEDNPGIIGRYVRDTDAATIKRIGKAMLYLRGARSTQKIEGLKKDASKLRSIPADKVVFDERDLMDSAMIEMALQRMAHSMIKEEAYLSTPSIPDYGIDKMYNDSTQHIWSIKCTACNRDCCLELDFPECVKFDKQGKAYRACVKCGAVLNPRDGRWIAQYPGRETEGRWIGQLNSIYVDPGSILRAFQFPPNGNPQEVYNSMLGLGYIAADNRLSPSSIYSFCGDRIMESRDNGPCGMGVDVGKVLHVVVGKRTAQNKKRIVWFGEVGGFDDLHDLLRRYNVVTVAVDYEPETRSAREFQTKAQAQVYLIDYKDKVKSGDKDDTKAGVTVVARTEICDSTHASIVTGGYVFPRRSPALEDYAKQMCNLAKVLEEDEQRGTKVYRYRKLGPDHYRHATNYFELASRTLPVAVEGDPLREMLKQWHEQANQGYDPLTYGMSVGR